MTDDRRLSRREKPVSGEVEDYSRLDREEMDEGPSPEDIARFSDATVTCPNCGTEILDEIEICWKCGHNLGTPADSKGPSIWIIATVVLVLVAFLLVVLL